MGDSKYLIAKKHKAQEGGLKQRAKDHQDYLDRVTRRLEIARDEIAKMNQENQKASERIFTPPKWVIEKSKREEVFERTIDSYIHEIKRNAWNASEEEIRLSVEIFLGDAYVSSTDYLNDLTACTQILRRLPDGVGGNIAYLYWNGNDWTCDLGCLWGLDFGMDGETPQEAILRAMLAVMDIKDVYQEKYKEEHKKLMEDFKEGKWL